MGQWAALGGTKEHKVIVQCIVLGLLSYSSNQSLHRCRNRPVIKNVQKTLASPVESWVRTWDIALNY